MKRLEKLPEIAAKQMAGLEANQTLLCKIRLQAAEERERPRARLYLKPVLAVCCALVLCVGAVLTLEDGKKPVSLDTDAVNVLDSHAAGTKSLPTEQPAALADVPKGSISMSAGMKRDAGSLFARSSTSSFPLVTLDGATYRMLENPDGISAALLGAEMGVVSEFNVEPALGSGGVVSNVIACGQSVHAVGDMGGALVAAEVDGAVRVFQRVSYAGTAVIGQETLRDTLCDPSEVEWIAVDGLGRAEGETAQELMNTLLELADYQSTAQTGSGSMQIGLKNGIVLQLMTGEDTVSACGTWSCPDFFEELAAAQ